jgi:hypothetical protein
MAVGAVVVTVVKDVELVVEMEVVTDVAVMLLDDEVPVIVVVAVVRLEVSVVWLVRVGARLVAVLVVVLSVEVEDGRRCMMCGELADLHCPQSRPSHVSIKLESPLKSEKPRNRSTPSSIVILPTHRSSLKRSWVLNMWLQHAHDMIMRSGEARPQTTAAVFRASRSAYSTSSCALGLCPTYTLN